MRKLLSFSLYVVIAFISNILLGCNEPSETDNKIPNKSYEEFYEDLKNTTIEMEVIFKDKRALFFYSNDEEYFVSTIKYENAQEFGSIYNKIENKTYFIDKGQITKDTITDFEEENIKSIFLTANHLFYLDFDKTEFELQGSSKILNRECNKYRYEDKEQNLIYNIYLDTETSLCLKCVSFNSDGSVELFFETKKLTNEPSVENYISLINAYKSQKIEEDNNTNNENEK